MKLRICLIEEETGNQIYEGPRFEVGAVLDGRLDPLGKRIARAWKDGLQGLIAEPDDVVEEAITEEIYVREQEGA